MIFFPYRADVDLHRIPFITILVCALCLLIFTQQLSSQNKYVTAIEGFCQSGVERSTLTILRNIAHQKQGNPCAEVFLTIRDSSDTNSEIEALIQQAQPLNLFKSQHQERLYMQDILSASYARFDRIVPNNLTNKLQYNPDDLDIKRMITSNFTHGDWPHIIFNLLFFFAFAASVEVITGSLAFIGIILLMSVSTGLSYSFSASGASGIPTIGLSGVVMGMMAMLAVLIPWLRIRCFLWFLIFIRRFSVPALLLAAGYVGLDIVSLMQDDGSAGINFVAHVSGAVTGALLGGLYWLIRPKFIKDLNAEIN